MKCSIVVAIRFLKQIGKYKYSFPFNQEVLTNVLTYSIFQEKYTNSTVYSWSLCHQWQVCKHHRHSTKVSFIHFYVIYITSYQTTICWHGLRNYDCLDRLKNDTWLLKSVHLKKTFAQSSFLSKVLSCLLTLFWFKQKW